jgi:hypothetical protein
MMKLATLLLSGVVALGGLASADALAHDKGRGYDRDDHPRHEVHRHKHYHDRSPRYYARDKGKARWKHSHGRDYRPYWYDYRPYRYEYRHKPRYRDSWYGIHLFFGG